VNEYFSIYLLFPAALGPEMSTRRRTLFNSSEALKRKGWWSIKGNKKTSAEENVGKRRERKVAINYRSAQRCRW
jgi:hypothetical protein